MKLDLTQLARGGEIGMGSGCSMAYLLSPIRRELESRIRESLVADTNLLVLDFPGSDLLAGDEFQPHYGTLLEYELGISSFHSHQQEQFDCIVSNLELSWIGIDEYIPTFLSLLKPGGHFYFSTFGPDTLSEVARAWMNVDGNPHIHPFIDMHHLGDLLLRSGFARPIVDADWNQVEFPDVETLLMDLKGERFVNLLADRRKTLTGKDRFQHFKQRLQEVAGAGNGISISFEIVYGYAVKPLTRDGGVVVNPPKLP